MKNEQKYDLIQDVSETNSIYKIYLCWMKGTRYLKTGDKLVIYRTSDFQGPAKYRSVCTSVCTVSEVKTFKDFENEDAFKAWSDEMMADDHYGDASIVSRAIEDIEGEN